MWRPVDFGKVCVLGWKVCVLYWECVLEWEVSLDGRCVSLDGSLPGWKSLDGRCVSFNRGWTALGDVPRTGVWLR